MAFPGLTPCPGGDCHGIDHAWCAPGKHAGQRTHLSSWLDYHLADRGSVGKHKADG